MVIFETVNELCLKITCRGGGDFIYTKAGAFVGGECIGQKNYTFTKVMLGPQENFGQALLGQLARRVTGENLPLMNFLANFLYMIIQRFLHGPETTLQLSNLIMTGTVWHL